MRGAASPGSWRAALRLALSLAPLAAFLVLLLLPVVLPADWLHARLWKGYYTVLLTDGGARPGLPALGPVVSRRSSRVRFNTFAGLAAVRLAELSSRLDPADPRMDPFLRDVQSWFRQPAGELAYVRTGRSPLLAVSLLGAGRKVLELDPLAAALRLLLLACAAFLILLPARLPHVPRWLLGLGLLPWISRALAGDLRDLLAFLLLFPFWVRAMSWAARQAGVRQAGVRRSEVRRTEARRTGARQAGSARSGVAARGRPAEGGRRAGRVRRIRLALKQAGDRLAALARACTAPRATAKAAGRGSAASPRAGSAARRTAAARARKPAATVRGGPRSAPAAGWARAVSALPVFLGLAGVLVFFLAAPGARHLPGVLLALAAELCLLAMLPAAIRWESARRAHPLFSALPILGAWRPGSGRRKSEPAGPAVAVPAALALLAFLSAGVLGLAAQRRDLRAPRLEPGGRAGLSWAGLGALPLSNDAEVPHLADFLAHEAYQQCLAFQRPYRFPSPGERVYVSFYAETEVGYAQDRRVARRFAESWLPSTLAAAPPGSVERLLADQGRAAAVRWTSETRLQRELHPWWRAAAVALFLLACLTACLRFDTRGFAL